MINSRRNIYKQEEYEDMGDVYISLASRVIINTNVQLKKSALFCDFDLNRSRRLTVAFRQKDDLIP